MLAFSCRYFRWLCHGRIWLVGAYGAALTFASLSDSTGSSPIASVVTASKCARAEGYGNTLSLAPSRNSDARSVMLRIPLPEYADGTLYIVQEVFSDDYDLSKSTDKHPRGRGPIWVWPSPPPRCGRAPSVVSGKSPRAVRVESGEWQMASSALTRNTASVVLTQRRYLLSRRATRTRGV